MFEPVFYGLNPQFLFFKNKFKFSSIFYSQFFFNLIFCLKFYDGTYKDTITEKNVNNNFKA